ncbi:uncharacterized protein FIESC28_09955 [Fusarium coffeatum]|uniref:Uncharacterized protein n=1 Tax=Fusarium coffeatum TaxID=231269 RepID=A0A366QWQ3_9HYPO|nr:uncharacterized protein FIESC28_09955 [Fusarium coffeatum]RBR09347.1 hypothetical protein FIESC28_09955 [Fusarium coffeatum]
MCYLNDVHIACPTCNNENKASPEYEKCSAALDKGKVCESGYRKRKLFRKGEECTKCAKIREMKDAAAVKLTEELRAKGYDV